MGSMNFGGNYDTNESVAATQELIDDLVAELAQPDYNEPPHTEEQLELQLRN